MGNPGDDNSTSARSAILSTGTIETQHQLPTAPAMCEESLYGFGERINPRRSFVFVSRVLGRHIPVSPHTARQAFTRLADHLPADLPGPVLVTSMAETAVGLGAGVHDAYLQRTGRTDVLNLSSTRTDRPLPVFGRFLEAHSHASGHTLYLPALADDRALLEESRTLVMVDDETSSGNTFRALAAALYEAGLDRFEKILALTLTDWSAGPITVSRERSGAGPLQAERFSLLAGSYRWTPAPDARRLSLPDPDLPSSLACAPLYRTGDARVGNSQRTRISLPAGLIDRIGNGVQPSCPVLVVGTGEHVWEPFLLAEAIEQHGVPVKFSATTRSPILIGHEIACAYSFRDHEGLGIRNYLYNVNPDDYSSIIICVDTSVQNLDMSLLLALHAHVVFDNRFIEHESLAIAAGAVQPVPLQVHNG